ncbi:hypothetical protein BDE02_05G040300 [Populus trichocarpa]|nr:hypothetical protein BDE02_05G040300 [Populus trichocarpa]
MGKASRWMINFFLGKKEEKCKKKDIYFYAEKDTTTAIVPSNPTIKRRWSFGKSAKKERVCKGRRSLDSVITTPYLAHRSSFALPATEAIKIIVPQTRAANRIRKAVEDAAATRIQAVFRSYLARKALCALRGLVKLQALVRGHQVRKQTAATLQRMHTLMTIQARTRCQRAQMARESQISVKSRSSRHREAVDVNFHEVRGISSRSGYINHPLIDRIEREVPRFYSGELQISRQEHQYKEFCFTSQNSPSICSPPSRTPGRASFTYETPDYADTLSNQFSILPNYMADTESSKAKFRSQSEPKQRPKQSIRVQNKQTTSMDGLLVHQDAQSQCLSSHSKHMAHENQDPWFIKLYQPTRSKDNNYDANITTSTRHSNYSKVLVTYEPPLNIY